MCFILVLSCLYHNTPQLKLFRGNTRQACLKCFRQNNNSTLDCTYTHPSLLQPAYTNHWQLCYCCFTVTLERSDLGLCASAIVFTCLQKRLYICYKYPHQQFNCSGGVQCSLIVNCCQCKLYLLYENFYIDLQLVILLYRWLSYGEYIYFLLYWEGFDLILLCLCMNNL